MLGSGWRERERDSRGYYRLWRVWERIRSHREKGYIFKKCGVWREIGVSYRSMRKRKSGKVREREGVKFRER